MVRRCWIVLLLVTGVACGSRSGGENMLPKLPPAFVFVVLIPDGAKCKAELASSAGNPETPKLRPDQDLTWVVTNRCQDTARHRVRIVVKKNTPKNGGPDPLDDPYPGARAGKQVNVAANGDPGYIKVKIKPRKDDDVPSGDNQYKYSIQITDIEYELDPEIIVDWP